MGAPKEWPPLLMGYDVAEEIRVVRNGQGVPATQPIPPDAQGHVPGLDIRPPYDPAAARALLDKFGYRDRDGDGWRERPDGQPLVLHIGTTPEDRERDDLFRKNLRAIGVRVEFVNRRWVDSPRWRSKASYRSARQSAALGVGDEQARIRGNSVRPSLDVNIPQHRCVFLRRRGSPDRPKLRLTKRREEH